jgi:intracellular multiplication protein IcmP
MWYVLNNVGRQTPGVEVGGIFCHWYYEMALKSPLSAPRVDGAITGLTIALSELIYIPDEKEKAEIMNQKQVNETEAKESKESVEQL